MSHDITEPPSPGLADSTAPERSEPDSAAPPVVDLESIERDLDDVQVALARLADGTYWSDEVTGETIADHVLTATPLARRA